LTLCVYTDNANAIHIYKKYGFEIMGTDYYRGPTPDKPHYIMQKGSTAFVESLREMGRRVMEGLVSYVTCVLKYTSGSPLAGLKSFCDDSWENVTEQ
jgi:hypothetical protein